MFEDTVMDGLRKNVRFGKLNIEPLFLRILSDVGLLGFPQSSAS